MNRKTPILVALILIALPSFASSVEFDFTEDFEDDTVGQNPTGTYTFIEESGGGANVISGGHTGQGLDVVANS